MSERIHLLMAQQFFGKSSVDECNLQQIKELANRYPYFAPAQFLLLEKLKKENSPQYSAQLQKTILYYHNPLEFEYFISSARFETEIDFDVPHQPSATSYPQQKDFFQTIASSEKEITDTIIEPPVISETTVATVSEEGVQMPAEEKIAESIERVPEQKKEQIKQPVSNAGNDLIFEPYHTVDYFASQGIKLSQEETTKDKLGRQLKSFTEWLKTMKRLPATEISENIDDSPESKVQHLADDSVHDADVVTEAMAEVWRKQGNKEKAIETYNKLGLLNPSKKAYFAGLIENLKRS